MLVHHASDIHRELTLVASPSDVPLKDLPSGAAHILCRDLRIQSPPVLFEDTTTPFRVSTPARDSNGMTAAFAVRGVTGVDRKRGRFRLRASTS